MSDLTPEEKELLEKMRQFRAQQEKKEELFWTGKYSQMSFGEKCQYWSASYHRSMRTQEESGLDPYSVFSPEEYARNKAIEPDYDKIMDYVFAEEWAGIWDKSEYLARIKR